MTGSPVPRVRCGRWVFCLLLAVAVLLAGCGAGPVGSAPPPAESSVSTSTHAGLARSVPVSVRIPRIGAQSTLIPLGLNADQTVQVPPVSTPMQAGWYENGPTPGEVGPAVILGHVDGNHQLGIFYRLHELGPGDEVLVARQDGSTARFAVTRVQQVGKNAFPTEAVYGDTADAELRLITCGGSFDAAARSYRDSIIVYAVLR